MARLVLILLFLGVETPRFSTAEINTYWSQTNEWKTQLLIRDEQKLVIDWAWFTEDYKVQKIPGQDLYIVFSKGRKICLVNNKITTKTLDDPERKCASEHGMKHRMGILRK